MAKRVIKINKGGASVASTQSDLGFIKGPRAPVRIGDTSAAPNPSDLKRTQPMQRIVIASSSRRLHPTGSVYAANRKPRKPETSSFPIWTIPVGIFGVIVLVVIIVSLAGNAKQDPYFQNTTQYVEKKPYDSGEPKDRPMKEYMEKHGPTKMAEARKQRMQNRPVTTLKSNEDQQ